MNQELRDTIASLYEDQIAHVYYIAAGGGTRLIDWLFSVPGASNTMQGAEVPYSARALEDLIGPPSTDSTVSRESCERMLQAAYMRARNYPDKSHSYPPQPSSKHIGVAVTAALATNRERKGADHAWVGISYKDDPAIVFHVGLRDRGLGRDHQEEVLSTFVLQMLVAVARQKRVYLTEVSYIDILDWGA